MECLLVAFAEAVAIIFIGRRRHRRIAEARMAIYIRRLAIGNVVTRRAEPVLIGALRDGRVSRRRRSINDGGLRMMGASG